MPDLKEIVILRVESELHTCRNCGYERGFHTSFINVAQNRDNPVKSTREVYSVIIICPECGARYDIGWRVSFNEFETRFVKAPVRDSVCIPHGSPAACLPEPPRHDERPPE